MGSPTRKLALEKMYKEYGYRLEGNEWLPGPNARPLPEPTGEREVRVNPWFVRPGLAEAYDEAYAAEMAKPTDVVLTTPGTDFNMAAHELDDTLDRLHAGAWRGDARALVLLKAASCVLQDRAAVYGSPEDNFKNIADAFEAREGIRLTPAQVASFGVAVKTGRLKTNPTHSDSIVDEIGYLACRARCLDVAGA